MSRQADKGNGFLKDKFGEFQADPPPEVWDAISNQLGGRRRKGLTLIIISAAASLALAVTLGIHYFGNDMPVEIELAGEEESMSQKESAQDDPEASSSNEQNSGLEQKVKETMAEAFPIDIGTSDISEVMKVSQVNEGQKIALAISGEISESGVEKVSGTGESIRTEKTALTGEATGAEEKTGTEEKTGAGEAARIEETSVEGEAAGTEEDAGDEETLVLILDAGDVGDVEDVKMMEDVVSQQEKDPRWVLGAMLSPLYSFRDAEPEALSGTSGEESGMLSYATGVQVGYRASRRLALESGIFYNKMGLSIGAPGIQVFVRDNLDNDWAGPEMGSSPITAITNSVGNIVSHSGDIFVNNYKLNATTEDNSVDQVFTEVSNAEQGIRQHLDYLELPFNLRYTLLDKSFKIQVLGGLSTNFLVNNYVTMETDAGTSEIGYLANIRNVNYSGNAGLGFVYHFLEQLSLNIEPRFRYYLNSVNDATLPSTRPYSFGIYTGLNYFF